VSSVSLVRTFGAHCPHLAKCETCVVKSTDACQYTPIRCVVRPHVAPTDVSKRMLLARSGHIACGVSYRSRIAVTIRIELKLWSSYAALR